MDYSRGALDFAEERLKSDAFRSEMKSSWRDRSDLDEKTDGRLDVVCARSGLMLETYRERDQLDK